MHAVIRLHAAAPDKPPLRQPCNGCGVCCASEPCPLGVLVTGRLKGRCAALQWVDPASLYRCGLIQEPAAHLPAAWRSAAPLLSRIARRYISAGSGCDCSATMERAPSDPEL
jgi:hypothetical protein